MLDAVSSPAAKSPAKSAPTSPVKRRLEVEKEKPKQRKRKKRLAQPKSEEKLDSFLCGTDNFFAQAEKGGSEKMSNVRSMLRKECVEETPMNPTAAWTKFCPLLWDAKIKCSVDLFKSTWKQMVDGSFGSAWEVGVPKKKPKVASVPVPAPVAVPAEAQVMSEVALVVPAQVEVVSTVALAPQHASAGGMQQLVPTNASYSANTIDQAMIIDNQNVDSQYL
jgi:hypothetical protein